MSRTSLYFDRHCWSTYLYDEYEVSYIVHGWNMNHYNWCCDSDGIFGWTIDPTRAKDVLVVKRYYIPN